MLGVDSGSRDLSASAYILKVQPVGFSNQLVGGCERKKRIKDGSKDFALCNWKDGV